MDAEEFNSSDLGNDLKEEVASLQAAGRGLEALSLCLKRLTANPEDFHARLLLAKQFYKLGFIPFCLRELQQILFKFPSNAALTRLISRLGGAPEERETINEDAKEEQGENPAQSDETLAEMEFDITDLNDLEKDTN